jgi:hypothetical protein
MTSSDTYNLKTNFSKKMMHRDEEHPHPKWTALLRVMMKVKAKVITWLVSIINLRVYAR